MPYQSTLAADSTLEQVRDDLRGAAAYALELRARPADQRGDGWEADVRSAVDHINFVDPIERGLAAADRAERDRRAGETRGPRGAFAGAAGDEARSPGVEFTTAEGYDEWASSQRGVFQAEVRTLLWSDTAGGTGAGLFRPVGQPYLRAGTERQARLFVRDLLNVQETGLSSVPYIREFAALTNETGAAMTAEASAKAEVTMQFEQVDAPVRKITAWVPATTEILGDAPTLRGYIDNRLAYMVLLREEVQVLNGNGTAPNLRGILQTTGIQTQSAVNNDVPATLGQAIGKVENVDGEADGVAINPVTYWAAMTTRYSTQFDNANGGNAPAQQEAFTWGLRAVRSRSMASLQALLGSYRMGATLFQREGVVIKVGEQHSDYFTTNRVAIVAEERIALAVHRPDWFVDATLDITP